VSREIRAALIEEAGGPFVVDTVTIDDPLPDEILVRLTAVGLCHTDLTVSRVWPAERLPMVFGHEGAGIVEAIGSAVTAVKPGDSVCLTFRSCGQCRMCTTGAPTYCEVPSLNNGGRADGTSALSRRGETVYSGFLGQSSFGTYAISYEANTIKVPADLDPTVAAPLGCGVQTGAGGVLNVLRPTAGDDLTVFGAGGVGMGAVMAAVASGCNVVVVDPVASRRDLAVGMGAAAVVDPTSVDDVPAAIRDLTSGGTPWVVETTGRPEVIASAVDAVSNRGHIALLGLGAPVTLDTRKWMTKGITMRGVLLGDSVPHVFIPRLVDLHARGLLPVERLVETFPFEEIGAAVAAAESGKVVKPVLVVDS
jgi:aryl-alcohol dehydrogenase